MAKKSAVAKNKRREKLVQKFSGKRARLLEVARDRDASPEEVFEAALKLQALPRNANPTRVRNRCEVTGRPRGYYRKLKMSRVSLRELGSLGKIPGLTKSSW